MYYIIDLLNKHAFPVIFNGLLSHAFSRKKSGKMLELYKKNSSRVDNIPARKTRFSSGLGRTVPAQSFCGPDRFSSIFDPIYFKNICSYEKLNPISLTRIFSDTKFFKYERLDLFVLKNPVP